MRYALIGLGAVAAAVLLVVATGAMLPVRHRASRQARFNRPPADLFTLINTPADFPAWRSGVTTVDLLPNANGPSRYRESGKNGSILYEVERSTPDRELVTRIADPSLPFGGTWTFTLTPSDAGTTLAITEDGEVYNPLFRFVSRFMMGYDSSIDTYLRDIARRVGQGDIAITKA
jgi:uncharacterized protein YndB with AHSA1/START domain